jgi:hypothetical protein
MVRLCYNTRVNYLDTCLTLWETRIGMDTHMRIGTDTHTRNEKEKREGEEWVSSLHRQWTEEIRGEGQIRRSRKHRRRGLTRSQKLLSSPIDFFSTIWDKICLLVPLVNSMRIWTLRSYESAQVLARRIQTLLFGTLSNDTLGRSLCPISMCLSCSIWRCLVRYTVSTDGSLAKF